MYSLDNKDDDENKTRYSDRLQNILNNVSTTNNSNSIMETNNINPKTGFSNRLTNILENTIGLDDFYKEQDSFMKLSQKMEEDRVNKEKQKEEEIKERMDKLWVDNSSTNVNNTSNNKDSQIDKRINGTKSKEEIDKQVQQASIQNVSSNNNQDNQSNNNIIDKDVKIGLASANETVNAQKLSTSDVQAMKEANEKNKNIEKGSLSKFEETIDTLLDNIYGGVKQTVSGLVDTLSTAVAFGIRGLEGATKIIGLDEQAQSLNNAYNSVVDFGNSINEKASYEGNVNSQVNDDFIRTVGEVTNTISNMIGATAIAYAVPVNISSTAVMGLSAGGSAAQEVLDKNKDNIGEATLTGIAKGYSAYWTEKMFDANILTRGTEKSSIQEGINRLISNKINSQFGKEFANQTVGIIGENVEELVDNNTGYLIDRLINDKELPNFQQWFNEQTETVKTTTLSTIIMSMMGLGGTNFKEIERDINAQYWVDQAQQIIDQENLAIHFNPNAVKDINQIQDFYITRFTPDGEIANIVPTKGKTIYNSKSELNVSPVVILDSETNMYNVIDGNTGIVLDSTSYSTTMEAEGGFNEKVNKLSDLQIKDINTKISKADYMITNEIMNVVTQAQEQLNQMTPTDYGINTRQNTEQNYEQERQKQNFESINKTINQISDKSVYNQTAVNNLLNIVSNNIKNIEYVQEDNGGGTLYSFDNDKNITGQQSINNRPYTGKRIKSIVNTAIQNADILNLYQDINANNTQTSSEQNTDNSSSNTTNYAVQDINKVTEPFSQQESYTRDEMVEIWNNEISNNNYDAYYDNNGNIERYIAIEEDGNNIVVNQYDNNNHVVKSEVIPNENGKYTAKDTQNIIKRNSKINEGGQNNGRNNEQKINRNQMEKNRKESTENSESNERIKEKLSKSLRNYEKQKSSELGKKINATIIEFKYQTQTEKVVSKGFNKATGLDINIFKTDVNTTDGAFYLDNEIFVKHNSLENKKVTNFKPYHELGHWLKDNKYNEWKKIYDLVNETSNKKQIEDYKSVLNNKSIFNDMSEIETREYIINEIVSDSVGNWANNIENWLPYIEKGLLDEDYVNLLADITLENQNYGYNIFGSLEQVDQLNNLISDIMTDIISKDNLTNANNQNNIQYSDRKAKVMFEKDSTFNRVKINEDIFENNNGKSISKTIHDYLVQHIGEYYYILESGQKVYLGKDLPNEYSYSKSTQKLTNTQKIAKGRAVSGLKEIIENATNRKYESNRKVKHSTDAKYGFYKYDTTFSFEHNEKEQIYSGSIVIRNDANGKKYLYDITKIKKIGSNLLPVASNSKKSSAMNGNSNYLPNNNILQKSNSVKNATKNLVKKNISTTNKNIQHSDRNDLYNTFEDNQGRTLSKQQQEYFKDSKVRDENGNLRTVYHTSKESFTVFNPVGTEHYRFGDNSVNYFTDNKAMSLSYSLENPKLYEGYLNITNPYIINAHGAEWNKVNKTFDKTLLDKINKINPSLKQEIVSKAQETSQARENLWNNYQNETDKLYALKRELLDEHVYGSLDEVEEKINKKPVSQRSSNEKEYLQVMKRTEQLYSNYNDYDGKAEFYKYFENNKEFDTFINSLNYKQKNDIKSISRDEFYEMAELGFNSQNIVDRFEYYETTNDIVFNVLEENKTLKQKYDGVIIKNVVDYGNYSTYDGEGDVFVTFNSNQFKNVDNTNPTVNQDIRLVDRDLNNDKQTSYTEEQKEILKKRQNERKKIAKMLKERSFFTNIYNSNIPKEFKAELIKNRKDYQYEPISNQETLDKANTKIEDVKNIRDEFMLNELNSAEDTAVGELLIKKALENGDYKEANNLSAALAEKLTTAGQTIQAAAMFKRMSADGMLIFAQRKINQINEELNKKFKINEIFTKKLPPQVELTEDKIQFINSLMQEMEELEKRKEGNIDGTTMDIIEREEDVIIAKIMAKIGEDIPTTMLDKLTSWRNISLLLNPKTIARNVVSNGLFSGLENVVDVIGVPIDKAVSLITGERSLLMPNLKTQVKGFKKGLDYAIYDTKEGISTSLGGNKYGLKPTKTFENAILQKLESASYFGVEGLDRPFMQAKYESALEMLMKLDNLEYGKDIPTEQMKQEALDIAKYTTFKDKNAISDFLSKVKSTMNLGKPIGLADIIGLTYTNIPGNLTKKAIDYSPAGLYNIYKSYVDYKTRKISGEDIRTAQRNLVQSTTRVLIGTGIMSLSIKAFLAGIITASGDDKDDKLQALTGEENYAINVSAFLRWITGEDTTMQDGDLYVTYSNYEPLSSIIAASAEMAGAAKEGQDVGSIVYEGLTTWINTIAELSTLNNFSSLFEYGDLGGTLTRSLSQFPSSFIPTICKQIAQLFEINLKSNYSDNWIIKNFINPVLQRIPGLSSTLESNYDTMGNEEKNYNGSTGLSRFYNVFLNTSYTSTINMNEVNQELYDLYLSTGSTDHLPLQVKNSFTYKGQKINLTAQEKAEYQKRLGEETAKAFKEEMKKEDYLAMTDEDKIDTLKNIINDLNTEIRGEVVLEPRGLTYDSTFTPNSTSLKNNGYKLNLTDDMQKEYEQIASEYYQKYANQGIYSEEKLEDIKSKSKQYAKNYMFKKYKSDLIKSNE